MRKFFVFLTIVAFLLPLSVAEGQVKIRPKKQEYSERAIGLVEISDKWLAVCGGNGGLIRNRYSGQEMDLWLDDNTDSMQTGVEYVFLHGDLLILGGKAPGGYGGMVGIYDLNNPMPPINRPSSSNNPYGLYVPQNWAIEHFGLKHVFVNYGQNFIGIYDETGLVSVYEMFGDAALIQEITVGEGVSNFAFDGDFFAVGNGADVRLYKFNGNARLYEYKSTYRWQGAIPDRGYTEFEFEYGHQDGIGLTTSLDRMYLMVQTNSALLEVIEINLNDLKVVKRTVVDEYELGTGNILSSDGEFAVLGYKIFHIPSAKVIGEFPLHKIEPQNDFGQTELAGASIRDLGSEVELLVTETGPTGLTGYLQGYVTTYDEPVFSVSSPNKVRGGIVELLTSSKVFYGGDAAFSIVADEGKKIRYTKEIDGSKNTSKKELGGLIYRIKNIQAPTGIGRVKFSKSDLEEQFFPAPYISVLGRPTPSGEPRKWSYQFIPGNYAGVFSSPTPGIPPRMVEIRVKNKKKVRIIDPANF